MTDTSAYFSKYEHRVPPAPLAVHPIIHSIGQICLIIAIVTGAWYLAWRWTSSLNFEALWFSVPLVLAETGAYIGLLLYVFNIWHIEDTDRKSAPSCISECLTEDAFVVERPICVDVFFPTYDEEVSLVRLSLLDAKKIHYPHNITIKIHVLDDGNRPPMRELAEELGCNYITRSDNTGFKAGNMRNAMEQTSGDFIVICDADTRPFPSILENTLGYFRDPDVAWVQTPQWFFDLPEAQSLSAVVTKFGKLGAWVGNRLPTRIGDIRFGDDPFVNDPKMFYDVIQRRRNWANASFCCGAGSIHRREATMSTALVNFGSEISKETLDRSQRLQLLTGEKAADQNLVDHIAQQAMLEREFTPYKFHVSEDIYTSIELHSDPTRNWRSVMHPDVESKMLSPQDLLTWTVQRFKYAGGTLDIALNDDFLFRSGLSLKQRLLYGSTVWSYFGALWNVVFLLSPIIYLLFAVAPVSAYSVDFYKHIFPFLVMTELGCMFALWGVSTTKSKFSYLAFFPVNIKALWTVARGKKISFPVTPKLRQDGYFLHLVWPQIMVMLLTTVAIVYGWVRFLSGSAVYGFDGLFLNTFWGLLNVVAMAGMVYSSVWSPSEEIAESKDRTLTQEIGRAA